MLANGVTPRSVVEVADSPITQKAPWRLFERRPRMSESSLYTPCVFEKMSGTWARICSIFCLCSAVIPFFASCLSISARIAFSAPPLRNLPASSKNAARAFTYAGISSVLPPFRMSFFICSAWPRRRRAGRAARSRRKDSPTGP